MHLATGNVVIVDLGGSVGHEQSGRRPAVVISNADHLELVNRLVTIVPCTTRDRGWPNHVPVTGPTGLPAPTLAITEQPRTIDRTRVLRHTGAVDDDCLVEIARWVRDWLV